MHAYPRGNELPSPIAVMPLLGLVCNGIDSLEAHLWKDYVMLICHACIDMHMLKLVSACMHNLSQLFKIDLHAMGVSCLVLHLRKVLLALSHAYTTL